MTVYPRLDDAIGLAAEWLAAHECIALRDFDPSQERDESGKWSSGGGGSGGGSSGGSSGDGGGEAHVSNYSAGKTPKKDINEISKEWDGRRKDVALGTITSRSGNDVVIIKEQGETVGVIGYRPARLVFPPADIPKANYEYIDGVATKRSGYGKKVMSIAIDRAKKNGNGLLLHANADVQGFYQKLGMKRSKSDKQAFYLTPDQVNKIKIKSIDDYSLKTIGQVVTKYDDQLTNAVHDVWNGHSSAVDLRRAHKAMLKDFAPQVYEEGMREGGIDEIDDEDQADMDEAVSDWLGKQFESINSFATDVVAVKDAEDVKAAKSAILDRVSMWVDSLRELGDRGRGYAMKNVKAFWRLGDRQTHTQDCIDLSKLKAHRISWWIDKGYIPGNDRHIGCGCSLRNAKTDEVIMGE